MTEPAEPSTTQFNSTNDLARLPYFELRNGQLHRCAPIDRVIDVHTHLALSFVRENQVDLRRAHDHTQHYLEEARALRGDLAPWQLSFADAVLHLAAEEFEACKTRCDGILESDPDVDEAWKLRGDAQRLAGQDPTASYTQAVTIRRSYFEALHCLAEVAHEAGDLERSAQSLDRALAVHPSYVPSLVLRARAHLAATEDLCPRALAAVDHARDVAPLPPALSEAFAVAERETGRSFVEAAWIHEALAAIKTTRAANKHADHPNLLAARALLFRARHALAFDEDPRPDLDALLERCSPGADLGGQEWASVLEAAFRERAHL